MKTRIIYFIAVLVLVATNMQKAYSLAQSRQRELRMMATLKSADAAMTQMNATNGELLINCAAVIKRANKLGFAGALYGYEAGRQGMATERFVLQAAQIFGTTNVPEVRIEIGTNDVDVEALNPRRRL